MSDFPEKENLEGQEEEFSTIFSDPVKHDESKAKSKKLLPKIIAAVLALVILAGGTVAVIKFIPVLEDDNNSSVVDNTISVKKLDADKIASVTVTNGAGVTELYSETEEKTEETSSSGTQTTETVNWYTKQVNKDLTASAKIKNIVSAVATISATREITQKTSAECGLDKPSVKAVVTPKSGDSYTVLLGAQSLDKTGYYLQIEGEEKIYLVNDSVYEGLQFELLDFADTSNISGVVNTNNEFDAYYEESNLVKFDRFELKGENFKETIVIVPNTEGEISDLYNFLTISPQKRLVENFDAFLQLYAGGITVSGAYSYDVSAASLKKFGLDTPDVFTTMKLKDKTFTFKFAKQEDGNYAVIGTDSRLIYKVSAELVSDVVNTKASDLYSSIIFLTHIDDIANFTFKTEDKEYSFDISKNEADEDGEEPEESYNVVIKGKTLKSQNFQNYYGHCLSLQASEYETDNIKNDPKVSIIITHHDSTKTVIDFTNVSATRYQASVNGDPVGKITATSLDKIVDLTEKVASGKTIDD